MAKAVFVKAARKDHDEIGVKKGESYWWAGFKTARGGFKRKFKNEPRPSQLTQSEYTSGVLSAQESVQDFHEAAECDDVDSLADDIEGIKGDIETMHEEHEEKHDTMEEAWPNGSPTLELLEERRDNLETLKDELDTCVDELRAINTEQEVDETDEKTEERIQSEIDDALMSIGWSF